MKNARYALYAVLVALVFLTQSAVMRDPGMGALSSPHDLAVELHATPDAPGAWPLGAIVPYRYRWVFRALVLSAGAVSPMKDALGFYLVFVALSALSLLLACVLFDVLLRRLGFTERQALVGVVLYLAGFPIAFAYDMPIHTREDLLENAVFVLALLAVLADRPVATVLATVLAANVREMGLLAAVPFWFSSRRPAGVRAGVVAAATAGALLVTSTRELAPRIPWFLDRTAWKPEGYQTTLDAPLEGALYVFVCFGALWFAALAGAVSSSRDLRKDRHDLLHWRPALLCTLLALVSSVALGQVREVRTVYLAFPWVIGLALEYLRKDFAADMKLPRARVAGGVVLAAGMVFLTFVASSPEFVKSLRPWIGESFQPGFEAPVVNELVDPTTGAPHLDPGTGKPEVVAVWPYRGASPWNGVWLILHASLSAAIVAARVGEWLRARKEPR